MRRLVRGIAAAGRLSSARPVTSRLRQPRSGMTRSKGSNCVTEPCTPLGSLLYPRPDSASPEQRPRLGRGDSALRRFRNRGNLGCGGRPADRLCCQPWHPARDRLPPPQPARPRSARRLRVGRWLLGAAEIALILDRERPELKHLPLPPKVTPTWVSQSLRVLATTTRMPWACRSETILSAPVVAPRATTSLAARLCAKSSSDSTPGEIVYGARKVRTR